MSDYEKRLIDLEIKFTHQDEFINELNKVVAKQQLTIERMAQEIINLRESHEQSQVQGNRTLKDDVPPHY